MQSSKHTNRPRCQPIFCWARTNFVNIPFVPKIYWDQGASSDLSWVRYQMSLLKIGDNKTSGSTRIHWYSTDEHRTKTGKVRTKLRRSFEIQTKLLSQTSMKTNKRAESISSLCTITWKKPGSVDSEMFQTVESCIEYLKYSKKFLNGTDGFTQRSSRIIDKR